MTATRAYPIPNLVQGVSQQSPQQRRDAQAEAQSNCFNSPVFGCTARPGTNHASWYPAADFTDDLIWDVYRTPEEQYRVVVGDGTVRVFDLLTGTEGTVNVEGVATAPITIYTDSDNGTAEFESHEPVADVTTTSWTINPRQVPEWTVSISGRQSLSDSWDVLKVVSEDTDPLTLQFNLAPHRYWRVVTSDYLAPVAPAPPVLTLSPLTLRYQDSNLFLLSIIEGVTEKSWLASGIGPGLFIDPGSNIEWEVRVQYWSNDSAAYIFDRTINHTSSIDDRSWDRPVSPHIPGHYLLTVSNGSLVPGTGTVGEATGEDIISVSLAYTGQAARNETLAYLSSIGKSRDVIRQVTVEDTTYLSNREVPVAMHPAPYVDPYFPEIPSSQMYEAFIYFKAGDYHHRYTVRLTDEHGLRQYTFVSSAGTNAANATWVRTTHLAQSMFNLLGGGGATNVASQSGAGSIATTGNYTVTRVDNLIRIRRTAADGGDFTITGFDDSNGDKMTIIKGPVSRYAQLPTTMFNQAILSVKPGADTDAGKNEYWVEFEGDGFRGTYVETFKPGAQVFLNSFTMPLLLISEGSNVFTLRRADWSTRVAGDGIKSAKDPSFVGKFIEDMTLWRDRLALVTEAGFALSKTSQYFTYFPDTVQTALDTDPIDVRITHRKVAILRHAVSHGGQMFLWARGVQFGVETKEALTQASIEIEPTTAFEYDTAIRPLTTGDNIAFSENIGGWVAIREQFATTQGVGKEYADVTSHVPGYIPSPLRWLEGSDSLKMYAMVSNSEPSTIYVYQYLVQGEEKQQSAWNKWTFPKGHNILYGAFSNGILRLCIQRHNGVSFETLDLSSYLQDQAADYNTRLDRKTSELSCSWTYAPPDVGDIEGVTTITVPWTVNISLENIADLVVITRAGGTVTAGTEYTVLAMRATSGSSAQIDVQGEFPTGIKFWIGYRIRSRYLFSRFIPKDDKGPYTFERVQVRAYVLSVSNTGWTEAIVTYDNGTTRTMQFSGRLMGSPTNNLDEVAITTTDLRIPIKSDSKRFTLELVNDSPLPSQWQAAEVHWRPTTRATRG